MSQIVKLSVPGLRAARHLAARNDIRYYLNGVLVDIRTDGIRLVGTNGHAMGVHFTEGAYETQRHIIIAHEVLKPALKMARKIGDATIDLTIPEDESGVFVIGRNPAMQFQPITGKYPSYEKVFPKTTSGEHADFNPALLAKFDRAARKLLPADPCVYFETNGNGAALARCRDKNFIGVIMPFKSLVKHAGYPSWFVPVDVPVKATGTTP